MSSVLPLLPAQGSEAERTSLGQDKGSLEPVRTSFQQWHHVEEIKIRISNELISSFYRELWNKTVPFGLSKFPGFQDHLGNGVSLRERYCTSIMEGWRLKQVIRKTGDAHILNLKPMEVLQIIFNMPVYFESPNLFNHWTSLFFIFLTKHVKGLDSTEYLLENAYQMAEF